MRRLVASLIATPLIVAAAPFLAQANPSADQIINSLKPHGDLVTGGTRGIRIGPAPAMHGTTDHTRVASARTHAAPASAATGGPSVDLTVDFATGSAQLTPQARETLDQLGKALSSNDLASYRFRIEGHTDTVGTTAFNRTLSEQRAAAVVDYLARRFGVQPARLEAVGMGEAGLLVPTPPQTAEPRNRRVQVVNIGA